MDGQRETEGGKGEKEKEASLKHLGDACSQNEYSASSHRGRNSGSAVYEFLQFPGAEPGILAGPWLRGKRPVCSACVAVLPKPGQCCGSLRQLLKHLRTNLLSEAAKGRWGHETQSWRQTQPRWSRGASLPACPFMSFDWTTKGNSDQLSV